MTAHFGSTRTSLLCVCVCVRALVCVCVHACMCRAHGSPDLCSLGGLLLLAEDGEGVQVLQPLRVGLQLLRRHGELEHHRVQLVPHRRLERQEGVQ